MKLLINGQRLIRAYVTDETQHLLWNSSKIQGRLRNQNILLERPSPEVAELFDQEEANTPTYDELASIPENEWKNIQDGEAPPDESSRDDSQALEGELAEIAREATTELEARSQPEQVDTAEDQDSTADTDPLIPRGDRS